jgi:hypothetical protein
MKPTVTKLLDNILKVLKRQKRTIADLARELPQVEVDGVMKDRDYHQVYDWFVRRQFNPQAEALMDLMGWYEKNKSKISVRGKRAVHAHT